MLKKKKSLVAVIVIGVLSVAIFAIYSTVNASPSLSQEEAVSIVQQQYEGSIIEAKLEGKDYIITLNTLAGTYEMTVPKKGGGIANIAKLEGAAGPNMLAAVDKASANQDDVGAAAKDPSTTIAQHGQDDSTELNSNEQSDNTEHSAAPSNKPSPTIKPTPEPKPSTNPAPTPKATASSLSEKQAGELALKQVAGEIDDIELITNGEQRYYLIEVEASNGQDAVVQMNAITGKVMSISWENDDQNEDDHEDDAQDDSEHDD